MAALLRVLVTRPAQEAGAWLAGLRAAGLDALALPLIAIEPAGDKACEALQAHWKRIASYRAVMFVSAAAVHSFFAQRPSRVEPGLPTDEAAEMIPADLRMSKLVAYRRAVKLLITNLTKGNFAFFIVYNIRELWDMDAHDWVPAFQRYFK